MEVVVLLLVALLPWALGGAKPLFVFGLYLGVGALMLLWASRMLVERRLILAACPITLCLAGLFLLGVWQITPLSASALRTLSPKSAELYEKLLPEHGEELPPAEGPQLERLAAGRTISLHPAGTQEELLRLLALVALYAAARSNVASAASFRRLAVVALVNGSLLALVGLLQFFSSPPGLVYWSLQTEMAAFGPVNRNNFAGYTNLCIGLGIGVFLAYRAGSKSVAQPWANPVLLWIGSGVVLMLTAVVLCQSRGGAFALLGSVAVVMMIARSASGNWRFGVVVLLLGLALGLAAWFGLDGVRGRMADAWKDAPNDERWSMWVRTTPFVPSFPAWGSGYGTYAYLECLSRPPHAGPDLSTDNAHNDYLNLLLEGGVVGLAVGLAALAFAYVLGVRGLLHHRDQPLGGIALGGLFALSSIALHSVVDFGMHLPAIAVLVAVVVAQLAALGASTAPAAGSARGWPLLGFAGAAVGSVALVLIAWLLVNHGYARQLAERYRNAAEKLEAATDPDSRQRRLDYLRSEVRLNPASAVAQQSLADALFATYRAERAEAQARLAAAQAARVVGGSTWASPCHAAVAVALADATPWVAGTDDRRLNEQYLRPALRRSLAARSLCPFLPNPHASLAAYGGNDLRGEPASVHLERACLVKPFSADLWFLLGAQQLHEGKQDQAWHSWRRSLECSDECLEEIVTRSRSRLSPEALAASVFPDDPELLYQGALMQPSEEAQRPLLLRAVDLVRERRDESKDRLLLEARSLKRLGRTGEAADAFGRLAARSPGRGEWRFEFAQVLAEQGRLEEARRELRLFLDQTPGHPGASELYRDVVRRLSEGR
jgi:O-antigen ligase/tetratricopeptide (TPR) repeat protein